MKMQKIEGVFTEKLHHKISDKLKAKLEDKWDAEEARTGVRPPEAFDYSFGLTYGHEISFNASPEKVGKLKQKILASILEVQ